jgi:hypothetical protein
MEYFEFAIDENANNTNNFARKTTLIQDKQTNKQTTSYIFT